MRTTVDLSTDLLEQALKLSGVQTKKAAIELGLRELIRQNKIEGMRKLRGRLHLNAALERSQNPFGD
jgi:Arc/MetJ family transcription regulator